MALYLICYEDNITVGCTPTFPDACRRVLAYSEREGHVLLRIFVYADGKALGTISSIQEYLLHGEQEVVFIHCSEQEMRESFLACTNAYTQYE